MSKRATNYIEGANTFSGDGAAQVLLVEDEPPQRDVFADALKSFGYKVVAAGSIAEGRSAFETGRFGVVVVDLGLPDGSGMDLIGMLSKEDGNLVSVVLTGDHEVRTVIGAMRAGAFDYLTKPVDLETLRATIGRAMAHHSVLRERAELFELLYAEREQLRSRVDAATADIRQYAAVCEQSNARLRSLLLMRQRLANEYNEESLLRCVYAEMSDHVPLRGVLVGDAWREMVFTLFVPAPLPGEGLHAPPIFARSEAIEWLGADLWTHDAERELRPYVEEHAGPEDRELRILAFPVGSDSRPECLPAFVFGERFVPDPAAREFLDMCAYILRTEWERNRLLSSIAHQASLGNIALELSRNTIQPLTAIRIAADYLGEALSGDEAAEGIGVIRENVGRLRDQSQEFRNLAVHREDSVQTVHIEDYVDQALEMLGVALRNRNVTVEKHAETHGECTLLNGSALARTILDMLLGGLRVADPGGVIEVAVRKPDQEHVVFEMWHKGGKQQVFADSADETFAGSAGNGEHPVGLRLAERTVYGCGGTLIVDNSEPAKPVLRIQLPTNAARRAHRDGLHA